MQRKKRSAPSVCRIHRFLFAGSCIFYFSSAINVPFLDLARAVRQANKELSDLVASREDHAAKIETLQTKCSDLLFQMKRVERDYAKAKKRGDQLQKEKDQSRSEMQKAMTMKHKLETLCRELQKENKRIKVKTNPSQPLR